jgi:hypothetical protein
VQKLLKEKFVPLAMNDWYLRRQEDAVGQFYRKMTEASPRGSAGQGTRQGRYVFTATGRFLGFNNNRGPERLLKMLGQALTEWEKLPPDQRKAANALKNDHPDEKFFREAPKDGAIVRVYTRLLEKNGSSYQRANLKATEQENDHTRSTSARDHLWLQATEVEEMQKALEKGQPVSLADPVLKRILRFHLFDNTRGEPPSWGLAEIQSASLTLRPQGPKASQGALEGTFSLKSADGQRSLQGTFSGSIAFQATRLATFQLLALGDHTGDGVHTRGARPGTNPIGFSFNLVTNPQPSDAIAPQFSHWLRGYWEAHRD